ncbi:hypothetical protein TPMD03_8 [Thiohalocapsa phage LS06-2018-MD03]|nr:hypothetical protein TPMD03_8 [Thiohalocapsa phage LS06-2018-MD03]
MLVCASKNFFESVSMCVQKFFINLIQREHR